MRKITFILLSIFCFTINVDAQRIKKEYVPLEFIQMPTLPVTGSTVNFKLGNSYWTNYLADLAARDKMYAEDLSAFKRDSVKATNDYEMAMENYSKKKVALKVVEKKILGQGKPELILPPFPEPYYFPEPIKISKGEINNQIIIPGFETVDGSADMVLEMDFQGYKEEQNGFVLSKVKTIKDKAGNETRKTYYYKESIYSYPVKTVLKDASGTVIDEQIINNERYSHKTEMQTSELAASLLSADANKEAACLKIAKDSLNAYLSRNVGFTPTKKKVFVRVPSSKKIDYSEFDAAYLAAKEGYLTYDQKGMEGKSKAKLNEAITIWEEAVNAADMNDKKARLNKKVYSAAMLNLLEAYMWTHQFDKVRDNVVKFKMADPGNGKIFDADKIVKFMEGYEKRVKIHQK